MLTYENRVAAMQLVAAHEAFYKRKLSIDQFCNGLDVLGVLNLIRSHPESMQPYFVHNTDTLLTPALLFNQFHNIDKVEDGTREVMRQHLKRSILSALTVRVVTVVSLTSLIDCILSPIFHLLVKESAILISHGELNLCRVQSFVERKRETLY